MNSEKQLQKRIIAGINSLIAQTRALVVRIEQKHHADPAPQPQELRLPLQLIDAYLSDLLSRQKDNTKQNRRENFRLSVEVLTLLALCFTLWFAARQLSEMMNQVESANRQTELLRRQLALTLGAELSLSVNFRRSVEGFVVATVRAKNRGQVAASNVIGGVTLTVRSWPGHKNMQSPLEVATIPQIVPSMDRLNLTEHNMGEGYKIGEFEIPIDPPVWNAMKSGKSYVALQLHGSYDNGFGEVIQVFSKQQPYCQAFVSLGDRACKGYSGHFDRVSDCRTVGQSLRDAITERKSRCTLTGLPPAQPGQPSTASSDSSFEQGVRRGTKSVPEWGLTLSSKKLDLLRKDYAFENAIKNLE